jgi:6-phosphogluconolactonase (cycloisomerase 2 family)
VAVDRTGRWVYVTNDLSFDVSAYTIDPNTGALTPIGSSTFPAGTGPRSVAVDPTSRFAYVSNLTSNDVWAYQIDGLGALTPIGAPVQVGSGPGALAVDFTGQYVYVANTGDNNVSGYRIDGVTGALTSMGSPFAAGQVPISVTTTSGPLP